MRWGRGPRVFSCSSGAMGGFQQKMPRATHTTVTDAETVGGRLIRSYGNLAMAHYAVSRSVSTYSRTAYMVRSRLIRGLSEGTMSIGSILDDERAKFENGLACAYCGSYSSPTVDHMMPRVRGGEDFAENLLPSCRSCNSSKGGADLLEWYERRGEFPPLLVLRRYLKVAWTTASRVGAHDWSMEDPRCEELPFDIERVPVHFPPPSALRLEAE